MSLFCLVLLALCAIATSREQTPLDEYVWRPDDSYRWELADTQRGEKCTFYTLFLISQAWYPELTPDHPYWWHWLQLAVPDDVEFFNFAALRIEGGSTSSGPRWVLLPVWYKGGGGLWPRMPSINDDMEEIASGTGSVVAKLRQVPNQPLTLLNDPQQRPRTEDDLIAWTWDAVFHNISQADFLLRAPMTKAAVRAMDAITEFTATLDERFALEDFFVFGASKRGWATWTTAAVDDSRVKAFAPQVLTSLNFVESIKHHNQVMGGYSFALYDYYNQGVSCYLDDPWVDNSIFDVVDPYVYIDRYVMPTFVIAATGDEFFIPDDMKFFWDDLPEPKYLNLLPNAEHSMATQKAMMMRSMKSFWYSVMTDFTLPKLTWTKEYTEQGGRLTVTTDTTPLEVVVWRSRTLSTERRDFRWVRLNEEGQLVPQPVLWFSDNATRINEDENVYVAEYDNPPEGEGWLGFLIQLTYPGPKEEEGWELTFTSEVMIVPNTLPFPPCEGADCCGTLV